MSSSFIERAHYDSMQSIKDDAEGAFRTLVNDQRAEPGTATASLHQFDDNYKVAHPKHLISKGGPERRATTSTAPGMWTMAFVPSSTFCVNTSSADAPQLPAE